MNKDLIDKLINIIKKTNTTKIDLEYSNDIIDSIFSKIWLHYSKILQEKINIPYPFFLDYSYPELILKDDKIKVKLFDSKKIKKYIYECCNNYTSFFEDNDNLSFDEIRNIKTPEELQEKYPKIYEIYDDVIKKYESQKKKVHHIIATKLDYLDTSGIIVKSFRYFQNFNLFINDLCDYFDVLLNNKSAIDDSFNGNLYDLTIYSEDVYYNLLYVMLLTYIKQEELAFSLTHNLEDKEKYEEEKNEIIRILENYSKTLEVHKKNSTESISLNQIKNIVIGKNNQEKYNEMVGPKEHETLPGGGFEDYDYVAFSHGKKYSIPIFYDDSLLIDIMYSNGVDPHEFITQFYLLKYSGLFEYGFNDDGEYLLGLKNEYNNYDLTSLFSIAMKNIRQIKEKNITFMSNEIINKNFNETKYVEFLKSESNQNLIYSEFLKLFQKQFKFNDENKSIIENINNSGYLFVISSMYFRILNNISDINNQNLVYMYIAYSRNLNQKCNKFIKFADKSFLKEEDFKELEKKIRIELEIRLGIEKLNDILEQTKNISNSSELHNIISNCLIKKKSINDEIQIIEKQKNETLENSPEYRVLNQRLNKLLLYKNHFDSEEVINGEGIFQDCYGFDFEGLYVFDYFSDIEDTNILKKAKRDYGHRIYILTADDYLKLKDLSNRTEVNKYIKDNLEPCADTMFHGENEEKRLLEKLKAVKKSIEKKNYVINLSKTDNPVTDEEILITQEEFDYYVSKYISNNKQVIEQMRKKSKKFETKESLEHENNIKEVQKYKSEHEIVEELTETQQEEIDYEIERTYVILEKINYERKKKGLEPLSFNSNNYYDVYKAIIDYEEEKNIKIKAKRDPKVALVTKNRTFYNNTYHCELCGIEEMNPIYLESHHFIPISQGGPDDVYNTVCLCSRCHKAIHNGLVTDYQNYSLIKTIKDFITSKIPEDLPFFEKTLGFAENRYLEQMEETELEIQKIQQKIENAFDKDVPDDEILKEIDELQNYSESLEQKKHKLNLLANRIQDYYRNSKEYAAIEEKTMQSSIKK